MINEIVRVLLAIIFVVLVVVILWYIVWKNVLEPNPLLRDFFDLDQKPSKKHKTKD